MAASLVLEPGWTAERSLVSVELETVASDRGRHRDLRFGGGSGRPGTLRRPAATRVGDAGRLEGKTLKASIEGEREGLRCQDHERMSRHSLAPPTRAVECRGSGKAQESNGPTRDAILPDRRRTFAGHKALGARSPALRSLRGNVERVSPSDEPGRVLRGGKALEGRNPMSGSGTKQARRSR
jgi:hypothetical protein